MTGTLVNVAAIITGSLIGIIFKAKIKKKYTDIIFQAIGLFTMLVGVSMALKTNYLIIMVFSLVTGSLLGLFLDIEQKLQKLSNKLSTKVRFGNEHFSHGLVTAFLLFCMGSMTILGAFEEGSGQQPNLLLAKSLMDGMSSVALAAAFGIGVMFSSIPLFLYQGGLTLLAYFFSNTVSQVYINELTAVGGILLIGLGLNILNIAKIKVINMLPSLVIAVLLVYIFL